MTIITGDVFSAFKAAGVDDDMATRIAAAVGDIKELTQEFKERLVRIIHQELAGADQAVEIV